jgi:hypothetical protein
MSEKDCSMCMKMQKWIINCVINFLMWCTKDIYPNKTKVSCQALENLLFRFILMILAYANNWTSAIALKVGNLNSKIFNNWMKSFVLNSQTHLSIICVCMLALMCNLVHVLNIIFSSHSFVSHDWLITLTQMGSYLMIIRLSVKDVEWKVFT